MPKQMTEESFAKLTEGVSLNDDERWVLRKDVGLPAGDSPVSFLQSPSTPMEEAFVRRARMLAWAKLKPKEQSVS